MLWLPRQPDLLYAPLKNLMVLKYEAALQLSPINTTSWLLWVILVTLGIQPCYHLFTEGDRNKVESSWVFSRFYCFCTQKTEGLVASWWWIKTCEQKRCTLEEVCVICCSPQDCSLNSATFEQALVLETLNGSDFHGCLQRWDEGCTRKCSSPGKAKYKFFQNQFVAWAS